MYSQNQLMTARQDELPRAVAQDHPAADAAPDRHANAAMRAGIKRRPRRQNSSHRLGLRLWTLVHAQSLLDGPGSGADPVAFIEDDYRRLRHNVSPLGY